MAKAIITIEDGEENQIHTTCEFDPILEIAAPTLAQTIALLLIKRIKNADVDDLFDDDDEEDDDDDE